MNLPPRSTCLARTVPADKHCSNLTRYKRVQLKLSWRSLVTSICLYACESWTLTAELLRRIQAMEVRCYYKILRISYKDHVANEEVRAKIQQAIGRHEDLLTIVKRRKLQWYGRVSGSSGLAKTFLQGVPAGSPSREDVKVCVKHKPTQLAHSFYSVLVSISLLWPIHLYFIP